MEAKTPKYEDYSLFFRFFVKHSENGFGRISPEDPVLQELDIYMEANNQFFYIADAILFNIKFISKGVQRMFGIEPGEVALGYFVTTTHPEDQKRHNLARLKLVSSAQELYLLKGGTRIISSNFRGKRTDEKDYHNYLYQAFLFYDKIPDESVYLILVITDISGFNHIHKGFHYYIGNDPRLFRFPDKELLSSGNVFSLTEIKILELIEEGLSTKEIAEKLFRSPLTINKHRANILQKSGKHSTSDVLRDLKAKGLL